MSEIELNLLYSPFSLWYHDPNNKNWDLKSYKIIVNFNSIEEYWIYNDIFDNDMITNGMFFIMKKDINPIWEDEKNIKGGCISLKILKDKSFDLWNKLSIYLLSNNLSNNINGISISPKKNFNIIKIWFNEQIDYKTYKFPDELKINEMNYLFRIHKMNIEKDKFKKTKN